METINGDGKRNAGQPVFRKLTYVVLGTVLILLTPMLAMWLDAEVNWSAFDFVVASMLLVGTGAIYVLSSRALNNGRARIALAFALAVALFFVWAELSVGIFDTPFAGT